MRHPIDPQSDCVFNALLGAEYNRDLLRDDHAYAHRYRLGDERGRSLLDHGGSSLFELSKFSASAVEREEQRWLKFFKDGEALNADHLPDWMQTNDKPFCAPLKPRAMPKPASIAG